MLVVSQTAMHATIRPSPTNKGEKRIKTPSLFYLSKYFCKKCQHTYYNFVTF